MTPLKVLISLATVLVLFLGLRWFFSEPTITVDFRDAPLSRVIAAIEKQGKIRISTNVDPDTPVTLQLKRAPVIETMEILSTRLDGSWRLAIVLAPDRAKLREGVALASQGRRGAEGWMSFFHPTWGLGMGSTYEDPRKFVWKVESMEENDLVSYVDQGSQKLPVQFSLPQDWNPAVSKAPATGRAERASQNLVKQAGGVSAEVFVLTGGGNWGERGQAGGEAGNTPRQRPEGGGTPPEGGWRGAGGGEGRPSSPERQANPEWMAERNEMILTSLPPEEQKAVREVADAMRAMREEMRDMDQEARREAFTQFAERPQIQEMREEAMARRDARRTPEQREQRYRRTVQRKLEAREAEGRPLKAKP